MLFRSRGNKEYVVSFMGYAPVDHPQVAIYVVVDRPNIVGDLQADAKFATKIVRNILTEVLPYMGIFMTEELSDDEREELEALKVEIMTPPAGTEGESPSEENPSGDNLSGDGSSGDNPAGTGEGGENAGEGAEGGSPSEGSEGEENQPREEPWRNFPIDPETGYAKDPETGAYVDPETGAVLGGSFEGGISPGGLASPAASPEASPQAEPSASPSASPGT